MTPRAQRRAPDPAGGAERFRQRGAQALFLLAFVALVLGIICGIGIGPSFHRTRAPLDAKAADAGGDSG